MAEWYPQNVREIAECLQCDGIGIVPTDTVYGVIGCAFSQYAVQRLYEVRKRDASKPFIILIADISDIAHFDITLSRCEREVLDAVWGAQSQRRTSVILSCPHDRWHYLHRGTRALAFRLVRTQLLTTLIRSVGPLVAPSANVQGAPVAQTVREARAYFGVNVDFYEGAGRRIIARPSRIIRLSADGTVDILRE